MMDFLEDYGRLKRSLPILPRDSLDNEDSPYVNSIHVIKNCYYCFDGGIAEDSAYCYFPYKIVDCFDCDYTFESQLCYQCLDCQRCYNCAYCQDCLLCRDCQFCYFCRDCHDCFGCVGLHHHKYCIFNVQYSEKEYFKKVAELKKLPSEQNLKRLKKLSIKYPRRRVASLKTENCPYGNYITNCANSYWIFDGIGDEDSAYLYQSKFCKGSLDMDQAYECEFCYSGKGAFSYQCSHVDLCSHSRDCHYCFRCEYCEHCWGCVNLNKAKYCILNKQYSKEEYFEKINEIKTELGWKMKN